MVASLLDWRKVIIQPMRRATARGHMSLGLSSPMGFQCQKPSQYNDPPIPGPSQSSESQVPSHEDALTSFLATPGSIIIIENMPVGSPPILRPFTPTPVPSPEIPPIAPENPMASSPHSHHEAWQEFTDL
ncbi:hypothetical protein O181_088344 [Austropuccinia psidii MF-1]|uniref:Uncharacterized protein n=1 Tax=Austropuccinia psidii MF-1 TaxID=1389203 RepID=A0A9Q3P3H2_9BASI|nr:hypothetical protein [Austropuccinia psidii MF-1]